MAFTFEQYLESVDALLDGKTQVVMVTTAPGIGTVTRTLEHIEGRGRDALVIRSVQYDDYDFVELPIVNLEGGLSVTDSKTTRFLCEIEGAVLDEQIVVIDEADVFFNPDKPEMTNHLIDAAKTGARMIWIGGPNMKKAIELSGRIPPELRVPYPA